jgi:hypothetical protein
MPADVQKVAVCPISGGRATDECRHALAMPAPDPAAISDSGYAMRTADDRPADYPADPDAQVYEDLFPVGAAPAEKCWVHTAEAQPLYAPVASSTPHVDSALSGQARPAAISGTPRPRLIVDRIVEPGGRMRMVVREQ